MKNRAKKLSAYKYWWRVYRVAVRSRWWRWERAIWRNLAHEWTWGDFSLPELLWASGALMTYR